MDDFNDSWVGRESINGRGMVPWEFDPTIYKPYRSCTFSLPAPSYLCFVASNLRHTVTKVKYTLFLFSPVSEQRSISVVAMECCTIPAARCNPILPLISKRSRLPNPAVRAGVATPVGATGSKVRIARDPGATGQL